MVSRKRKEKLFALKPTNENIDKFKLYNKTYNKLKRTLKHSYYRDKFEEYSGNMKKTPGRQYARFWGHKNTGKIFLIFSEARVK